VGCSGDERTTLLADLVFTIVVPTYRRAEQLSACLTSCAALEYPRERFEVVVVDDGTDPPPHPVVARHADALHVRLVEQRHGGPAAARNAGARVARGRYLVFTDDDCTPAPNYLTVLERAFAGMTDRVVGGHTVNALDANLYSTATQGLVEYLYHYFNTRATDARFFTSSNLALARDAFDHVGGFDETFPLAGAEDRDLCDRLRDNGYELVYVPDAVVRHAHRMGFGGYCRQHFHYGRGAYYLHRARATRGDGRRFQPTKFYLDLVLSPMAKPRGRGGLTLTALMALSQVAYGTGYYLERARHGEMWRPSLGAASVAGGDATRPGAARRRRERV
jgi:GT2 family glycosyltransferase